MASASVKKIEESKPVIALVDIYTFAIQCLQRKYNDDDWNAHPSIAILPGGRIISANWHAKSLGITTKIRRRHAEKIMKNHPGMTLKSYELPIYDTGKPNQTILRGVAEEVLQILIEIVKPALHTEPVIEWVMLDEFYINLTEEINYYLKQGLSTCHAALYTPWNDVDMSLDSLNFNENMVHSPNEAIDIDKHPKKYPMTKSRGGNYSSGFSGCKTWPPITTHECRKALAMKLVNRIMQLIQERTQIQCTGGIGANKMMSKIACSITPSGTLYYLSKGKLTDPKIAEKVPIKQLARIPPPQRRKLKNYGLVTAKDIQIATNETLQEIGFSEKESKLIKCVAKGFDDRLVISKHFQKNINAARNFYHDPLFTEYDVRKELGYLLLEFKEKLMEQMKWTKPRIPEKLKLSISYVHKIGKTIDFPTKAINGATLLFFVNLIDYNYGVNKMRVSGIGLREVDNGKKAHTDKEADEIFWGPFKDMYEKVRGFKLRQEKDVDPQGRKLIMRTEPTSNKPNYEIYCSWDQDKLDYALYERKSNNELVRIE